MIKDTIGRRGPRESAPRFQPASARGKHPARSPGHVLEVRESVDSACGAEDHGRESARSRGLCLR